VRILGLDPGYFGLDWYVRCQDDGHKVKVYCPPNTKTDAIGKGLIERVDDWRAWMRWADLVILTDNTKFLTLLEPYRREGVKIIGPTPEMAAWELDRNEGMRQFKKHGIPVPEYREFNDYDSAIAYVKREGRPFVSKPSGDEPDKSLSYVAKSPADLVYMLERWKKAKRHKGAFILQEKVSGIEMAVGGWFGPGGFNRGWCENWEEKKLMNGGLGVSTGEQGTTLRMVRKSKLADMVLAPFAETLERMGYCGYIDVNCIIDDDGTPWPLEFTCRPGWPTFNIQQQLVEGDHAEWLASLSEGNENSVFRLNEIALGVVMSIPDYPYSHLTRKEVCGIPIYLEPRLMPNVHLCEVAMGEAPQDVAGKVVNLPSLVTAGDYVMVVAATSQTVSEARRKVYRILDGIKVPNSPMWRTDIGRRLSQELPKLQSLGFATGMEY
jgi:phosphoribosylamine--glycine ligase